MERFGRLLTLLAVTIFVGGCGGEEENKPANEGADTKTEKKVDEPVPPPKKDVDEPVPPPKKDVDERVPPPKKDVDERVPPPKKDVDEPVPPPKKDVDERVPPPKQITNSIGMKLLLIPAGEFRMGSPEGEGGSDAHPQHRVKITQPFYLGKHEVTQRQYLRIMGNNPSLIRGLTNHHPVENVSWDDAVAFCGKLSQKEGKTYRLPTEAEWEYACRAGSSTMWSFGDSVRDLCEYAWFGDNSDNETHPVGQKKRNAWELHDMHGNVYEWCADWYGSDYYAISPVEDPTGPPSGASRVLRGGSWYYSHPDVFRCAYRSFAHPEARYTARGFRVARTLTP